MITSLTKKIQGYNTVRKNRVLHFVSLVSLVLNIFSPYLVISHVAYASELPENEIVIETAGTTEEVVVEEEIIVEETVIEETLVEEEVVVEEAAIVDETETELVVEPEEVAESTETPEVLVEESAEEEFSDDEEETVAEEEIVEEEVVVEEEIIEEDLPAQAGIILETDVDVVVSEGGTLEVEIIETQSCLANSLNPCVITDKDDYTPNEVVLLNGYGYEASTLYTLVIYSDDEPTVRFETKIETDENGAFDYSYQLDGTYRPQYYVEVLNIEEEIVADTSFTDPPVSGTTIDSDGVDDQPGQKDLTQMVVDYNNLPTTFDVEWNWDETGWSGNNTGDACALFDTNGNGFADSALCVTVGENPAAYQDTRLYTCADTRVDRCAGSTEITTFSSTCTAGISNNDPFPTGDEYPDDTRAQCTVDLGDVSGALLLDVCSYPSEQPNSDPSDCIIFQPRTGRLEVVKVLDPTSDAGLFNLQIDGASLTTDVGHGGTTGEQIVDGGDHTVGETAGTGTSLSTYSTAIVCKDLNGTGSTVASSSDAGPLTVPVEIDDDIVCTITNSVRDAHLVVIKHVDNDNGGTSTASNFTMTINGVTVTGGNSFPGTESPGTDKVVSTGSYNVTETGPSGYTASYSTDCTGTIAGGETKTCTVTNTDDLASLTLQKLVVNLDGGTALASAWTLTATGTTEISGTGPTVSSGPSFDVGTYDLSESGGPSGYTASAWECVGGTQDDDDTVTVGLGETITCTITNDDIAPTLTLHKSVTNDDGGTAVASNFQAYIDTTLVDWEVAVPLSAGDYTASEDLLPGYTASDWFGHCDTDGTVSLAVGENKDCYVNNFDVPPTLKLVKDVTNDDGGTAGSGDWALNARTLCAFGDTDPACGFSDSGDSTTFHNLDAGRSYLLFESGGPSGYTEGIWQCDGGTLNGNRLVLGLDDDVTCTITNDDNAPTLKLTKSVTNDDGGTAGSGDWTLNARTLCAFGDTSPVCGFSDTGDSTTFHTLAAGRQYTLFESGPDGYTEGSWQCDGGTLNGNKLVLGLDDDVTCTITNDDIAPTLKLAKDITNNNGGNAAPGDWTLNARTLCAFGDTDPACGFSDSGDSTTFHTLAAGKSYNLFESGGPSGYTEGSWQCDGGTLTGNRLVLGLNDAVTCTITNDDQTASITLIKDVINDNGGNAGENDFSLTIGGTGVSSGQTLNVNANTPIELNETLLSGYAFVGITGDPKCPQALGGTATLDEGEDITCTITNDDITASITLYKDVTTDDGGTAGENDFNLTIGGTGVSSGQTLNVLANTSIALSETVLFGYTFEGISGDRKCPAVLGGTVTLDEGESLICTIYNDDIAPTLTLEKTVVTDDGGTAVANDFQAYIDGNPVPWGVPQVLSQNDYTASEDVVPGYTASDWGGNCIATGDVSLLVGENKTCTITNDDVAPTLTLHKTVINNNGGTAAEIDFQAYINGGAVSWGSTEVLSVGDYTASEDSLEGYDAGVWTGDCAEDGSISLSEGEEANCYVTNDDNFSDVHGIKWEDLNGNGERDCNLNEQRKLECEPLLGGWTIFIDRNGNGILDGQESTESTETMRDGNDFGWYWFEKLLPGTYRFCEVLQAGWLQTFPGTATPLCHTVLLPGDEERNNPDFGNVRENPVLRIAKSNNTGGSDKQIGGIVTFTIVLTVEDAGIENVNLFDLPSEGFNYIPGSWTAFSSIRGNIKNFPVAEPTYSSPGMWFIGEMELDEVITLTYETTIGSIVDPGLYKDLAWGFGESFSLTTVLALAQPTGFVDTNFVGTAVNVVDPLDPVNVEVEENEEEIIEEIGEVLGLPSTGASETLTAIFVGLMIAGLALISLGLNRKKRLLTLLVVGLLMGLTSGRQAYAAVSSISVQIEDPTPAADSPFEISFVTLDIENRALTAQCYKKAPSDGAFVAFGGAIALPASGGSDVCDVTAGILIEEGSYKFKVNVDAGGDNKDSDEVTVAVDTEGPDRPKYVSKDKQTNCKYDVSVKTADDGQTVSVDVYRSFDKDFTVSPTTFIHHGIVGPNTEYNFTDTFGACGSTPYYAARAYDSAGNPSDITVEETTKTVTKTVIVTETVVEEADPIAVDGVVLSSGGDTLGEDDSTTGDEDDGTVFGEGDDEADFEPTTDEEGINPFFWILLIVVLLILLYVFTRRGKNNQSQY